MGVGFKDCVATLIDLVGTKKHPDAVTRMRSSIGHYYQRI